MQAHETGELIEHTDRGGSNTRTALTISLCALSLAFASLGGSNSAKEATHENILSSNAYAFYQAKSIRQTSYRIAADNLEIQLLRDTSLSLEAKALLKNKIQDYRSTADRYESEPKTKEGKKELLAKALVHENNRDHAMTQDPWFDYAEGMLQIAIVLLSISLIASMPFLYLAGSALGLLGFLSTIEGFFLIIS